ncbi:MAG: hypothetical protein K5785_03440 [Nitrosarchaeum sp.]|nr:hypothetical protein [Nitrosarchaeum sp.]
MTDIKWKSVTIRLEKIKNKYCDTYFSLQQQNPNWKKTDARLAIFIKCKNVLRSTELGAVLTRDHAQQKDWWKQFGDITNNETKIIIDETLESFNKTLRFSLVFFLFSMIESSFRAIVKSMDHTAYENTKRSFKNMYSWLLSPRHITLDSNEYEKLLDILRLYRNSFHNNGVYLPDNPGNTTIHYKNKQFDFIDGKNMSFDTWDNYLNLVEDVHDMLESIVKANEIIIIQNIPSFEQ